MLINRLKKKYQNNKGVVKNFSFLTILQFVQIFVGFLLFPYLINVLGSHNYGVVIYAQTLVGYFVLVLNYGFNITSTKRVALNKNNRDELLKVISTTYFSKIFILIILTVVYFPIIYSVPFLHEYKLVYGFAFLGLIGWLLFPEWYFQGIEKMENITYVMLTVKLLSLLLILIFVKKPKHFYYVPIINSIVLIIAGILGVYLMKRSFKGVKVMLVFSFNSVKKYLKEGFAIFLSNITANTKDYLNTIIVGTFLSYEIVGIYDFANKIVRVLIIPSSILLRVIFPKVTIEKSHSLINKIEKISLLYTLGVLAVILFLLPNNIWIFIVDSNVETFRKTLQLLALSLPLLALCGTRGTLKLVAFNREKDYTKGILISVLMYFVFIVLLYVFDSITLFYMASVIVMSLVVELGVYLYYGKKLK